MLQRVQSIYLLLASGSCFGLFGTDVADTPTEIASSELFADASFNVFDDPLLMGGAGLAGALLLVTIFLFRNRSLQAKLGLVCLAVIGFVIGFGGFNFFTDSATALAIPDFGIALPALAMVFLILGMKNINKDEKLVRSADRLR